MLASSSMLTKHHLKARHYFPCGRKMLFDTQRIEPISSVHRRGGCSSPYNFSSHVSVTGLHFFLYAVSGVEFSSHSWSFRGCHERSPTGSPLPIVEQRLDAAWIRSGLELLLAEDAPSQPDLGSSVSSRLLLVVASAHSSSRNIISLVVRA